MTMLQITIDRPWREVCCFLEAPRNFARWAAWLGPALRQQRGDWVARLPDGARAKVRFTERNAFGVADHWLIEGEERATLVALRAVPHGLGSEVMVGFFADVDGDGARAAAAAADAQCALRTLKALLEAPARRPDGEGAHADCTQPEFPAAAQPVCA